MSEVSADRRAAPVVLGPAFRPEDAWAIHALVERAAPGDTVEVDFRRVRECSDFALAMLARDILAGRTRVHGMSQHQQRILGYLGVPVPEGLDREIVDF